VTALNKVGIVLSPDTFNVRYLIPSFIEIHRLVLEIRMDRRIQHWR